ncbi:uncharacterized protein L201_004921 [Kwoniella dendrophila CBS 6074]|uniref:Signal peptidase complex subunit 1 n=1 Tax=Kwoniella dendrophila CBS 6074 TaxID=1295534 RepID=A0AAX4JXP2_9TREE
MNNLPVSAREVLEGRIDPRSQHIVEQTAQTFLIALTVVSFGLSYTTSSVLYGLEVFLGGLIVILLISVPPWPFLNKHPVKFLPVRKLHQT